MHMHTRGRSAALHAVPSGTPFSPYAQLLTPLSPPPPKPPSLPPPLPLSALQPTAAQHSPELMVKEALSTCTPTDLNAAGTAAAPPLPSAACGGGGNGGNGGGGPQRQPTRGAAVREQTIEVDRQEIEQRAADMFAADPAAAGGGGLAAPPTLEQMLVPGSAAAALLAAMFTSTPVQMHLAVPVAFQAVAAGGAAGGGEDGGRQLHWPR